MTKRQLQALDRLELSLKVCKEEECSEKCPYYNQAEYQSCNACQIDDMEVVLPTLIKEWKTLKIIEEKSRPERVARWLQKGRALLGLLEKKEKDGD